MPASGFVQVSEVLRTVAPAKVNLVLEVLGIRPDGYHEIDTILQELELGDEVEVTLGGAPGIRVSGAFAAGTPESEENLAWRAAQQLAELVGGGVPLPFIHIEKRVPPAGGLGGGAADAAAVLRLLADAWPGATPELLLRVASAVGSDPPFFLVGGTARATGRGEHVGALPDLAPHDVVLFIPPESLERKTARAFAAIDRHEFDDGTVATSFVRDAKTQVSTTDVFNAFERVAFELFPSLATLWEELEQRIGEPIRLAGAGPTLFWIGPLGAGARVAAAAAGARCSVIPTTTRRRA